MMADIVLTTYGEPPTASFLEQWYYSNRILFKLTRLVAPIPSVAVPFIGAYRGYKRKKQWLRMQFSSPLESITEFQAKGIQTELNRLSPAVECRLHVAFEFRPPFLHTVLTRLKENNCRNLILVPMYTMKSDFTTDISLRDYERFQQCTNNPLPQTQTFLFRPHLKELSRIMADHIRSQLDRLAITTEDKKQTGLLLGCHGTLVSPPKGISDTGYRDSFALYQFLVEELETEFHSVEIGWLNHRLGGEWTSPTLQQSAQEMLENNITRIVYFPFGFLADNAETRLEARTILNDLGIGSYHHLPCLNDNQELLQFIAMQIAEMLENPQKEAHPSSTNL